MSLSLIAWAGVTLGHFLMTSHWAGRLPTTSQPTRDERLWLAALLSVGSLAVVLHVVTLTAGLSLATGAIGLIAWHGATAAVLLRFPRHDASPSRLTWSETLASLVTVLVVVSWADVAGRSASVDGTDAAHYHVPNAVNYALGASPFDLTATQHLYPVGGSLIAAWCIVPTGTPLVIDVAMIPAFLLMLASINWMFRLATGLSGLAWTSWLVVALSATPLFRLSSLVSGDLWFTAGYLALAACLVTVWTRRAWTTTLMVMGALAAGLLVGSKTSGAPAAALILGTYGVAEIVRSVLARRMPTLPTGLATTLPLAALMAIGAGGIWIIRNWMQFGSPLAPGGLAVFGVQIFDGETLQPTTYLSVLGDQQTIENYDTAGRLAHYTRQWLGRSFLPYLWPAGLILVDFAALAVRRRWDDIAWARAMVALLVIVPGLGLLYLLAGAPWTSLEWTRGFALRYALPVIAGVSLTAAIGVFPISLPWYRERAAAAMVLVTAAIVSVQLLIDSFAPGSPRSSPVPPLEFSWAPLAALLAAACWWAAGHPRRLWLVGLASVVVAAALWVPPTVTRHQRAVEGEQRRLDAELAAPRERSDPHRLPLLTAIDAERDAGQACDRRRFFTLSRFDTPLALQTPAYRSQVFYAGRDADQARAAGPLAPCDYVVADPATMATDKGQQLLHALAGAQSVRRLAASDRFVVFGP